MKRDDLPKNTINHSGPFHHSFGNAPRLKFTHAETKSSTVSQFEAFELDEDFIAANGGRRERVIVASQAVTFFRF